MEFNNWLSSVYPQVTEGDSVGFPNTPEVSLSYLRPAPSSRRIGTLLLICHPFFPFPQKFYTIYVHIYISVQFSHSVVSNSLRPHESQHARPPCPSPTPGVHPDSRPSSQWCHPAISSSAVPFSSCPQSLPALESFPISQLFKWGGQSTGVSALASFLPKKSQGWSPSEWTGWISLQSKGLSATLMPNAGPGGVPAAATVPLPALPEITEPPSQQASIPEMETSGQHSQDSISAGPPKVYLPFPWVLMGSGKKTQELDRGCALPRNRGQEPHYRCPSERSNSLQFRMHVGTTISPL